MPARKAATVAWACAGLARSPSAMAGRLGRYMSMASGPMAVSAPSRITRPQGVGTGVPGSGAEDGLADVTAPALLVRQGSNKKGKLRMSALETMMPPVQRADVNGVEIAYYEAGPREGVPI